MEKIKRARVDVQSYREAAASDPEMTCRALVLSAVEAGFETLVTITPFLAGGGVAAEPHKILESLAQLVKQRKVSVIDEGRWAATGRK